MAFEIVTIPCLQDNYAFLLHNSDTGETALIDIPEAAPIDAELERRGWKLNQIWITHHHWDHIDGLPDLEAAKGAKIIGGVADAARLPDLDLALGDGDTFDFAGAKVDVFDVSGHTIGHIAFYCAQAKAMFTADSLMAMGCGRLFEGTPDQMWDSLQKLAQLPADTLVCSGHEYTASNAKFALTIEPESQALKDRVAEIETLRSAGKATVPSLLSLELATNPFLRAGELAIKSHLGMSNSADSEVFAEIRKRKDNF